jgi:ectoine hydroxylase-related dioxygenase (phytanoyl-CoA dioxygenase family)
MKKTEIDNLLRGIGIEPVAGTQPATIDEAQQQLLQEPKAASTTMTSKTQQKSFISKDSKQSPLLDQTSQQDINDYLVSSSPNISLQTQLDYSRSGHTVLRSFLPPNIIQQLRSEILPYTTTNALIAWRQKVEVQLNDSLDNNIRNNAISIVNNLHTVEECMTYLEEMLGMDITEDIPFLQYFNTWRVSSTTTLLLPTVRQLCLSPYLAQTACTLLNCNTVRLYQDSIFHKRASDTWTPWHSDARMSPFDTSNMISFWIPLQYIPHPTYGGTGLLFVDCSHADMALPYWNGVDGKEYDRLDFRYGGGGSSNSNDDDDDDAIGGSGGVRHHMPMDIGDVTVHNGWTLHCADAAEDYLAGEDRYALSVTYVDGRAEVREDVLSSSTATAAAAAAAAVVTKDDKEDVWSFRSWVSDVIPRTQFRHPEVPIVWPLKERDLSL